VESYKTKLRKINTFIFDVDGVLTDGSVSLYKDEVVRTLNSRDGYAMQYAIKMGYRILIITGGNSESVKSRLDNMGIQKVVLSASNKLKAYEELKSEFHFEHEEVLYMGDDIPDYEVLNVAGVSTCPADASVEVKSISDYVSPYSGGRHCVRDVIEQTLRVQGKWFGKKAFNW
jgi:3-deoxy-D-manno-octulosonate 8-phosphate phosphatase (KDO 8-P phosphatase)